MSFCTNCGKELNDNAPVCVNCGTPQAQAQGYTPESNQNYTQPTTPAPVDNGGFLWGLLGCCIPVVGLILFLVWKDTKPKSSKAAGIGALVSVILAVVFYIVMIVIGVAAGVAGL